MIDVKTNYLKYLTCSSVDEEWGIVVTTVGCQSIPPGGNYPILPHPSKYTFNPSMGRTLNEYQLLYITRGSGSFVSSSCKLQKVKAGTIILLFPNEWHSYVPDSKTGWDEFWVGFRGVHIDKRVEHLFFTPEHPFYKIGLCASVLNLYEEIIRESEDEKSGYQQLVSSIVLHMLGKIYYHEKNLSFTNVDELNLINNAREIMKSNIEQPQSMEEIACSLNIGYSKFRKIFKEYTGMPPAQYQLQLRLQRARDYLSSTPMSISDIADSLGFDSLSQFSSLFRRKEKLTPREFRERFRQL